MHPVFDAFESGCSFVMCGGTTTFFSLCAAFARYSKTGGTCDVQVIGGVLPDLSENYPANVTIQYAGFHIYGQVRTGGFCYWH